MQEPIPTSYQAAFKKPMVWETGSFCKCCVRNRNPRKRNKNYIRKRGETTAVQDSSEKTVLRPIQRFVTRHTPAYVCLPGRFRSILQQGTATNLSLRQLAVKHSDHRKDRSPDAGSIYQKRAVSNTAVKPLRVTFKDDWGSAINLFSKMSHTDNLFRTDSE